MKSIGILIFLFLMLKSVAFADEARVYFYRFEISNAKVDGSGSVVSKRMAKYLVKDKLDKDCIDLQELGYAGSRGLMSGTEGLVMKRALNEAEEQNLKESICAENGLSRCKVKVTVVSKEISKLSIQAYLFPNNGDHLLRGKPAVASLKGVNMIPTFSAACQTGEYRDSWNNAASTAEARSLLKNIGLDIKNTRTLNLVSTDEEFGWSFGFPDHRLDAGDVAAPDYSPRKGKAIKKVE